MIINCRLEAREGVCCFNRVWNGVPEADGRREKGKEVTVFTRLGVEKVERATGRRGGNQVFFID